MFNMKIFIKHLLCLFFVIYNELHAESLSKIFDLNENDNLKIISTINFKGSTYIFLHNVSNDEINNSLAIFRSEQ